MKIKSIISVFLAFTFLLAGCSETTADDDSANKEGTTAAPFTDSAETAQTTEAQQKETAQTTDQQQEETTNPQQEETAQTTDRQQEETTVPQQEETAATDTEITAQTSPPVISPDYDPSFFKNDLFIGDSISTGLYLYGYLDKANVFAEVGLNPESAAYREIDGVTCIQKAQGMNPAHIYIMLGTNGLAFLDSGYMAKKITELIEGLETVCPAARICVISISPVTKAHDAEGAETMDKVNAYNKGLEALCTAGGYTFIDLCSLLKDNEGYFSEDYAEQDGLHFKGVTYKLLLNTVQTAVR